MTNYNKNPFFVLLITLACFNTYSQTSNSPTISLNKVLLNPAFAGDKGKNRISIQNAYNDYQHDYKQDYANNFVDPNDFRNNANASNNTSYWSNYANLNNSISYDGYSNKTGIGYLFNIGSTGAHESNEKWNNSSNSNFVQKESKFTTGHIGESYSIKTLGAGLNYKFFLKAKEDENPGTLSLGLYYSLSQYSIQRSEWGSTFYKFNNFDDSSKTKDYEYHLSQNGIYNSIQRSKVNLGLAYNIKKSYIALNIEESKIGYSGNAISAGLMAGTVFEKKVEQPKFSFVPQVYIRLNQAINRIKIPSLSQEKTESLYDRQNNSYTIDTTNVSGFSRFGYNNTVLDNQSWTFVSMIQASTNLDFHYKKAVLGLCYSTIGVSYNIGVNYTNFKMMLNVGGFKSVNGSTTGTGENMNQIRHVSLSTNILF